MKRPTRSIPSLLALLLLLASTLLPSAPALAATPPTCQPGEFLETYYAGGDPTGEPTAYSCVALPDIDQGTNYPGADADGSFAMTWEGQVDFRANTYAFSVEAAGDFRLAIDGVQQTGWSSGTATVEQAISAGTHTLRLEYNRTSGPYAIRLTWSPVSCGAGEYRLTYYRSSTPTAGNEAYQTCAPAPAGNWPSGRPEAWLGEINWSARFTGNHTFKRGIYTLAIQHTGGGRLQLGNQVWSLDPADSSTLVQAELKGTLPSTLDLYHAVGQTSNAVALTYSLNNCAPGFWRSAYYDNPGATGSPALTGCEALPDYHWPEGQPGPWVGEASPPTAFAATWSGSPGLAAGRYRFHVSSDDGFRLAVNGVTVLNSSASTQTWADVTVARGTVPVSFTYWTEGGDRRARLWWERLDAPGAPPLRCPAGTMLAEYAASATAPADYATCEERSVDWGTSRPSGWAGLSPYTVRWTGDLLVPGGTYNFTTETAAGNQAALRLNDHLVLTTPGGAATSTYSLEQQPYRVEATYTGDGSEATVPTTWAWTGATGQAAGDGDFAVSYFHTSDLTGTPAYTEFQPIPIPLLLPEQEPGGPLYEGAPQSIRWEGEVTFPSSRYRFYGPDGGLRLTLRDSLGGSDLVLDRWSAGSPDFVERSLNGTYTLVLEHRAVNGQPLPRVWWTGLDTPRLTSYDFTGEKSIQLTFDRPLQPYRGSPANSFFLHNANGNPLAITGVNVAGNRATLSLPVNVLDGQTVSLSYFPDPVATVIQDAATGSVAGDLALGRPTTGGGGEPAAPVSGISGPVGAGPDRDGLLLSADYPTWQVDLEAFYSLAEARLAITQLPADGSLAVAVSGDGAAWTDAASLDLSTLAPATTETTLDLTGHLARYVRLTYSPSNPAAPLYLGIGRFELQGSPQGPVAGFIPRLRFANDQQRPVLARRTDGTEKVELNVDLIVLTYDEKLDTRSVPQPGAYEVKVDGEIYTPTSVVVQGQSVTLYLPVRVKFGQAVSLTYTPGANPVRDVLQHAADALANKPVDPVSVDMINLARRPAVTASQVSDAGDSPAASGASRAVDGSKATAATTKVEAGPWWEVDLGQVSALFDLTIYLPNGVGGAATPKYRVLLSEGDDLWNLVYLHDGSPIGAEGLKIDLMGRKAQKLRIEVQGVEQLTFSEVEIWGYPPRVAP